MFDAGIRFLRHPSWLVTFVVYLSKTINNKIQIHFSIIHLDDSSFIDFLL